jgi:Methyltransferase domain
MLPARQPRRDNLWGLVLDYPVESHPRWGHGTPPHSGLAEIIAANRDDYATTLEAFRAWVSPLRRIACDGPAAATDPWWDNRWFPPIDALALYGFLRGAAPTRYVEIGSGHSTRFARRAISDGELTTTITSIDPHPRVEIDALCDLLIRAPLERADLSLIDELQAGDVLFVDGSHRVFMNSDTTLFWLEVFPRLRPGVRVHVHDVFLPFDYPEAWAWRYYSEQYMLGVALLAAPTDLRPFFPSSFILRDPSLVSIVGSLMHALQLPDNVWHGMDWSGSSFWVEVGPAGALRGQSILRPPIG